MTDPEQTPCFAHEYWAYWCPRCNIDHPDRKMKHKLCQQCEYGYPTRSHKDETPVRQECWDWNAAYPIGTPVIYHEVIGDGKPLYTRTTSLAWFLGYSAVAKIEGKMGGCSIRHMIVYDPESKLEKDLQLIANSIDCTNGVQEAFNRVARLARLLKTAGKCGIK